MLSVRPLTLLTVVTERSSAEVSIQEGMISELTGTFERRKKVLELSPGAKRLHMPNIAAYQNIFPR